MKISHHFLRITATAVFTLSFLFAAAEDYALIQRAYPRVPRDKQKSYAPSRQRRVGEINLAPRGLLILANFADTVFQSNNTAASFDSLANSDHYSHNGAYGSTREYFRAQSGGQYVPDFDIIGPVTLPYGMAYYGANDALGYDRYTADFVIDAVDAACKMGADLSRYDNDNDGEVDFVYILYAGYGEQDTNIKDAIWPHNWDIISNLYSGCTNQTTYYYRTSNDYLLPKFQGYVINNYACSPERRRGGARSGIGVFSHEFGHVLGLPDYYPTAPDATISTQQTPGTWSIMGYACYTAHGNVPCNYSVYDKYYLGWIEPELLTGGEHTMPADNSVFYMVTRDLKKPANGAFTQDTVYYLENRQYKDWDKYLPGHGLLIWQVVYDHSLWYDNTPNDYSIRYNIISANGNNTYSSNIWGHDREGCPFPGTDNIQQVKLFNYTLQNITEDADGNISFRFVDSANPTGCILHENTVEQTTKYLKNGRIIIKRGSTAYTVLGEKL